MRTYTAELAPWRVAEIHPAFIERAKEDAARRGTAGPKRHAYETTCPYCGEVDHLVGVVRIGSKDHAADVPMTKEGYMHLLPDPGEKETELLIVRCMDDHVHPVTGEEGPAAIDPMAYLSPAVFYAIATDVDLF